MMWNAYCPAAPSFAPSIASVHLFRYNQFSSFEIKAAYNDNSKYNNNDGYKTNDEYWTTKFAGTTVSAVIVVPNIYVVELISETSHATRQDKFYCDVEFA